MVELLHFLKLQGEREGGGEEDSEGGRRGEEGRKTVREGGEEGRKTVQTNSRWTPLETYT